MAQKLEQTQTAVQTQQLQTMQVAIAKMVELPVTELAERVRNEMLDNAALEEKDDSDLPEERTAAEEDNEGMDEEREQEERETDEDNSYEDDVDYGSESDAMAIISRQTTCLTIFSSGLKRNVTVRKSNFRAPRRSTMNCKVRFGNIISQSTNKN